jgi:hypothetical protein
MGFVPPTTIYRLQFEGDYAGLEVRMRASKLRMAFDAQDLLDLDPSSMDAEDVRRAKQIFEVIADHLVSWNVETEDGEQVPASIKGLLDQEMPMVGRIFAEWQKAMVDVPAPLSRPSSSGAPMESLSLPMEPLSPANLAS